MSDLVRRLTRINPLATEQFAGLIANRLMANGFLASSPDDCRARAEGFRIRAHDTQPGEQKKLFLYFAQHWDLLAVEIGDSAHRKTAPASSEIAEEFEAGP